MRAAGRSTAALLMALAAVLLPAATPAAYAGEPCVGVIVDARLLGGGVSTGCADGDPDTGLQALTRAGFTYAFVPRQPGLVCQIDGAPECARTTTTTYWSYWYRDKGSTTWTYATQGAAAHDPRPGSTEAWVWQDGGRRQPPDIALRTICPQWAAPKATPAPTGSTPAARPKATKTTTAASTATGPTRARTAGATPSSTATPPSTAAAATTAVSSAAATPTASSSAVAAPAGRAGSDDEGGAPVGSLLAGVGLVGLLAAAAVARARREDGTP